jgi:UDP-4-amino-4,6-dideoxy-N-acetyl-beta-L-altrosamine transaminase
MNIPYGRQHITEEDIGAVVRVLRSDLITQGPAVPEFERSVAEQCGARHAIAVSSATAALHISCLALGVGSGDIVWTSAITFVASANCALYCGASVDFVDIDAVTYNICVDALEAKLEAAKAVGRLPKVLVAVHFSGQSCDMGRIGELSRQYGFVVIEDASHAIGGRYRGQPIGSGGNSAITVFSFHPVKIVTTGEGGMAVTQDADLAARLRRLRTHGTTRDPAEMTREPEGDWYYQQIDLGFNYRLTDFQAALGQSQMRRLSECLAKRKSIARRYDGLLAGLPLALPAQHPDAESAWHLYVVRLLLPEAAKSRLRIFSALRADGIGVNVHYIPVYRHPYFERLGFASGHCPRAEEYYAAALTLPLYPGLSEKDQDRVVSSLRKAIAQPTGGRNSANRSL